MIKEKNQINNEEPIIASGMKRILAALIDGVLIFSLVKLTYIYFSVQAIFNGLPMSIELKFQQAVLVLYFYFIFSILPNCIFSQSLGKLFVGIKVVSKKYERLSLVSCILRDLIARPIVLLAPISIFNQEKLALHDRLSRTVVVEAK
jgi:uncharacterized RDD family membrane protein YckC